MADNVALPLAVGVGRAHLDGSICTRHDCSSAHVDVPAVAEQTEHRASGDRDTRQISLTDEERRLLHDGVCSRHRDTAPGVYVCRPCETASDAAVEQIVAARLAAAESAPETARTLGELLALPLGVVVRSSAGTVAARFDAEHGVLLGDERTFQWSRLATPVTVLWRPEVQEVTHD